MKREDMTAAAYFRATCARCGKRSDRDATRQTTDKWMTKHEELHRLEDRVSRPTR